MFPTGPPPITADVSGAGAVGAAGAGMAQFAGLPVHDTVGVFWSHALVKNVAAVATLSL